MNILLISFEFPPQPGGIGTYSYQIAKNLHYLNNNITALVNTNLMSRDEVEKFDNFQEFNIIRFKNYKNKVFKIIHRIFFSCKVFESKKYDLIFITYSHAGIIGIIGKYLYKIPYIMMGHGSEFLYKNRYLNFFIRLFFNCSDLIFANSKFTADLMRNRGIINKNLKVIPLGADEKLYDKNRYNPDLLKKKYGFEKRQIILTVGNLSIRKGHKYVIEAVQILKDDFPNILYLIIGRGKEREYLESLIEKYNLHDYVKIIGFVSTELLPEYYALCDFFILNSTKAPNGDVEGFGIVLVESGLMGKPVIGTKGCGIVEIIEHNKTGLLIEKDSIKDTTSAIRVLLKDVKLRKSFGQNFYLKAIKTLTWKAVAHNTNNEINSYFAKYSTKN